jgi:hypothetical protein
VGGFGVGVGVGGISVGVGVEVGGLGVAVGVGGISVAVSQLTLKTRSPKRQANNNFFILMPPCVFQNSWLALETVVHDYTIESLRRQQHFTTSPTPVHNFFTGLWHNGDKSRPEEVEND